MDRRDVIGGVGAVLAGGVAGCMGIGAAEAKLTIESQPQEEVLSGESQDGEVESLELLVSGSVEWNNFEDPIDSLTIALQVDQETLPLSEGGNWDDKWRTVASESYFDIPSTTSGGPFEFEGIGRDILDFDPDWTSDMFEPDGDGETKQTEMSTRVYVTAAGEAESDDDNIHAEGPGDVHTIIVEVTDLPDNGGGGGDPSISVSVEISGNLTMA